MGEYSNVCLVSRTVCIADHIVQIVLFMKSKEVMEKVIKNIIFYNLSFIRLFIYITDWLEQIVFKYISLDFNYL